jgi:Leucine-rich repeat (LRR) protein
MECRVQELDICLLRIRDLGTVLSPDVFPHLATLDLSGNLLTSAAPLRFLPALRVLSLSANRLGTSSGGIFEPPSQDGSDTACGDEPHILPNLEVLKLASNRLSSLEALQAHRLPSLRSLFVHNNLIQKVEGLACLAHLEELVRILLCLPHWLVQGRHHYFADDVVSAALMHTSRVHPTHHSVVRTL